MRLSRIATATTIFGLALLGPSPLRAFHELVVLPGGAEVCLNGARFTAKVYNAVTVLGDPIAGSVYDGPTFIGLDPDPHAFSAVGEWHRYEVRYPATTFGVGDLATL